MDAALLAAGVGAIAGVVGLAVGRLWDSWSERRRWRRDVTRESFERTLEQFYAWRETLRSVALTAVGSDESAELVTALRAGHTAWNQRLAAIWLHATDDVAEAAYALDHELSRLHGFVVAKQLTEAEWMMRRKAAQQALDDLVDRMRRQLDLGPMRVTREQAGDRLDGAELGP